MTLNQLEGNWRQATGILRKTWGELTNDALLVVKGNRDVLAGKLQARYGIGREHACQHAAEFGEWFRANVTPVGRLPKPDPGNRRRGDSACAAKDLPAKKNPVG